MQHRREFQNFSTRFYKRLKKKKTSHKVMIMYNQPQMEISSLLCTKKTLYTKIFIPTL